MIKLPIVSDWHVCTPTIFRFIEEEHVSAFFNDGSIRLSSFSQFKKHGDEQRLDLKEGETTFVHRTSRMGGQTIMAGATTWKKRICFVFNHAIRKGSYGIVWL